MTKKLIRRYWLLGALLTFAMFAVLYRVAHLRFENSDDTLIVKAFMGFEGGVPATFSLYVHTMLAWTMAGLSSLAPGIPWFSLYQVGLLVLGGTVILKALMQLAQSYRYPWLMGSIAGGLFLVVFMAFISCRINYTTTAALAGAAAVVQLLTVRLWEGRKAATVRAYALSLLLLVNAYCLRAQSALPAFAFCALVFGWFLYLRLQAGGDKHTLRGVLLAAMVMVVTIGALWGIRQAEISVRGLQPEIDWHRARTALMDYTPFESDPALALAADSGLSAAQGAMVRQWYFLDAAVTTQALQAMADAYLDVARPSAISRLSDFLQEFPRYPFTVGLLVALCGLCWLGNRKAAPLGWLVALLSVLGAAALLLLLSWQGRIPARAADAALTPCAALLMGLVLMCPVDLRAGGPGKRFAAGILLVAVLGTAAMNANVTLYEITRRPDAQSMQREAELESYAQANPDKLVVRSPNLLRDTRLLPIVRGKVPGNIAIWGDWVCHTPSWYYQLEQYGFNGATFTAANWLTDRIVLATADPGDTVDLCTYLTDQLGQTVEAVPQGENGTLTFYRFAMRTNP